MRLLEENYGGVRIFSDRPYGYKRYHVDWGNGREEMFSGLWYSLNKVKQIVEGRLNDTI
tara:strand:+ start:4734 stop:4910 length:177 start_codon:yes stop_codon:yes gene_type:complete